MVSSPGIPPLPIEKWARNHVFKCHTSSLVAPTAVHVDGITKLGTAATASLISEPLLEEVVVMWFTRSSHQLV